MAGEYRENINPFEEDEFETLFEDRQPEEPTTSRRSRKRSKATLILAVLLLISLCCNIFFVIRDFRDGEDRNQPATDQSNLTQQDGSQFFVIHDDKENGNSTDASQPNSSANGNELTQEEFELLQKYMQMIISGELGTASSSTDMQPPVGVQPNQTANGENQMPETPVVCEKPKVVLTENDYKDRVRTDTKVVTDATTALLDNGLWLNTEGQITVNLYGSVSKVYAAVGTEEYREVQLFNAAEYSYFIYQVSADEQVLFKLEMVDGSIYYFSVYDR